MSTIPKEHLDKIKEWFPNDHEIFYRQCAMDGYQLATDGREELEKELNNLKGNYEILETENEELQSQCTEKEKQLLAADAQNLQQSESLQVLHNQLKEKEEVNRGLQNACKKWETICEELKAENERLKEQYGIMDGRRERAIKSLEESEKQFEQLQEAYNKLIGS